MDEYSKCHQVKQDMNVTVDSNPVYYTACLLFLQASVLIKKNQIICRHEEADNIDRKGGETDIEYF